LSVECVERTQIELRLTRV